MTLFNIYDEDGRITQTNKVYDPTGYANRLREVGHNFVESDHAGPIDLNIWSVTNGALTERPTMDVSANKTEIKAGGTDVAAFSGLPVNSRVTLRTGNMQIGSQIVPGTAFELPISVPCVYDVLIEKWPFRPFSCSIRATS